MFGQRLVQKSNGPIRVLGKVCGEERYYKNNKQPSSIKDINWPTIEYAMSETLIWSNILLNLVNFNIIH